MYNVCNVKAVSATFSRCFYDAHYDKSFLRFWRTDSAKSYWYRGITRDDILSSSISPITCISKETAALDSAISPIHTADADETKLSSRVASRRRRRCVLGYRPA